MCSKQKYMECQLITARKDLIKIKLNNNSKLLLSITGYDVNTSKIFDFQKYIISNTQTVKL